MRVKKKESGTPAGPAIGRCGKIKIGEKMNGTGRPVSLDYFIPYCNDSDYIAAFRDGCGDKPAKISIFFLSDDACNEVIELYDKAGKVAGKSDGESIWYVAQSANGVKAEFKAVTEVQMKDGGGYDSLMEKMAQKAGGTWKHRCSIAFMIPSVKVYGQWVFETGGTKTSVQNIVGAFDAVKKAAGTVVGLAFDLSVTKVKGALAGDKSYYPVVSLTLNMSPLNVERCNEYLSNGFFKPQDLIMLDDKRFLALEAKKQAALPAPKTISI